MNHEQTSPSAEQNGTSRRRLLFAGAGTLVAGTVAGCGGGLTKGDGNAQASPHAGTPARGSVNTGDSILNRIKRSGKVRLGVDLSFQPLEFRDPKTKKPTGYSIEVSKLLAQALGAKIEWVEIPFAELFAAQQAGRFDFAGIQATNTPERAQQVAFAYAPTFLEGNYLFEGSKLGASSPQQLNDAGITIASVTGTSQANATKLLFPKAKLKELPDYPSALADVTTGRSDVLFVGDYAVGEAVGKGLKLVSEQPVNVAWNTYFLPMGDVALHQFVTVFLQYKASDLTLANLWQKFVGSSVQKYGVRVAPVKDPYLAAAYA